MGFFNPFSTTSKKTEIKEPVRRTSRATAERIKSILRIRELESLPANAAQAFQLASDPKTSSDDFIGIIEKDESLSARVVRIGNSAFFSRGGPATDVEKAVANIGLEELRGFLSATMLRSLLKTPGPIREQIWTNSVGTAIICRLLAVRVAGLYGSAAFLWGLLHDVGKLIILHRVGDEYNQILHKAAQYGSFIQAEEEVFELNHVEVGLWIAEEWNFPPEAMEAIASHHQPLSYFSKREASPGLVVRAADTLAHAAGLGHTSAFSFFAEQAAAEISNIAPLLGVTLEDLRSVQSSATEKLEDEYSRFSN